jgi:hypothetical protein
MAYDRKKLVKSLREEGRKAFFAGKSRQSNPHKYMDAYQWNRGFDSAEDAVKVANMIIVRQDRETNSDFCK